MSEMEMRVARAIMTAFIKKWFLGSYRGGVWLDCVNGEMAWKEEARAAIEAMREPTEAMAQMGSQWLDRPDALDVTRTIWRAMIDEALK